MKENDWLHNFGAGIVAVFLMLSPIICVFSWKWAFTSSNDLESFGYSLLGVVFALVSGFGTALMYDCIKES